VLVNDWITVLLESGDYGKYRALHDDEFLAVLKAWLPLLVDRSQAFSQAVVRNWLELGFGSG
jgi:hypothetical protein